MRFAAYISLRTLPGVGHDCIRFGNSLWAGLALRSSSRAATASGVARTKHDVPLVEVTRECAYAHRAAYAGTNSFGFDLKYIDCQA